ncbi:hypothetical protein Lgee_1675 [Legionella geestiana]|uniref:Uncharacterized protein n=1 Tax=Legionella geestiana TaxID=45065 RepID=A0A0W0TR15_9GAMM|nr:hypothetical protein [Legionella geestiana]KTC97899.1 hypothetical protein Lgee_1675 [Legionella geestiana]QBS11756.1 hypothetical protein E4T54_02795 [Legionella geestiana]QDQ40632.1 hypothetical protein E3226_009625 [Legionella geestiana]STX53553.1 Uncharacterised protein [Legionella geestiana]
MSATEPLNFGISAESLAAEIGEILDFVEAACNGSEQPVAQLHVPRPIAPRYATPEIAHAACEQELDGLIVP